MGNYESRIEQPGDPFAHYWFYGRITREEAENRLNQFKLENGLFLAREKLEFAGNYAISVCYEGTIYHYHVMKDSNDMVKIQNGEPFIGLVELVKHYETHQDGMVNRLKIPCERPPEMKPIGYIGSSISRARLNALIADAMQLAARNSQLRSRFYYEQRILKIMHKYQTWYYENIDRQGAEIILRKGGLYEGKFLIREHLVKTDNFSNTPYVLSLFAERKIQHFEIDYEYDEYSVYSLMSKRKYFGSLVQLVDYYHRTKGNLPTRLVSLTSKQQPHQQPQNARFHERYVRSPDYYARGNETIMKNKIYKEIWIPQNKLRIIQKLGAGFYGVVYLGELIYGNSKRIQVALKTLKPGPAAQTMMKELLKECKLIQHIDHPYVTKMLGISYSENYGLMLALELAPLGSLELYVKRHKEFRMEMILNLMYQVAKGMEYLSSKNIVHRDLAARNVLLKSTSHAKITDFGLSKLMSEERFYEARYVGKWPIKWYPPEAIRVGRFSEKSDVWSYGVTMWEAVTYGELPYANINTEYLLYALDKGERLPKPHYCPSHAYNVMLSCWMRDPEMRSSFHDIVALMRRYKLIRPSS